ncbi:hypothetical protein CAEBREN_16133 [Caenorhabditis brenneri]|uniref:Uncharacterized protein n=1 Tax=Caenorhabditis brenneri TaxID=135651 RepID=G0MIB4_CAEBE|nr:hypothetical protein CAEBREN_16133 [Caenorhabditis brenneri]
MRSDGFLVGLGGQEKSRKSVKSYDWRSEDNEVNMGCVRKLLKIEEKMFQGNINVIGTGFLNNLTGSQIMNLPRNVIIDNFYWKHSPLKT